MKSIKWVILLVVVAVVIGFFVWNAQKTDDPSNATEPEVTVSAEEMIKEYATNKEAAEARYKNKRIEISGKVINVEKDVVQKTFVHIYGKWAGDQVSALMRASEAVKAEAMKNGDQVALVCTDKGNEFMSSTLLEDCVVASHQPTAEKAKVPNAVNPMDAMP